MAKYVYVRKKSEEKGKYYEVKDFSFDTISNMPFYNQKYFYFQLWEGQAKMYEDEIYHIFPGELVKTVVYGKKLSYAKVKQIILNDPKYESLLKDMNSDSHQQYMDRKYSINNNNFNVTEDEFCIDYDNEHFCIFSPPDNFYLCRKDIMISIEEFDSNIKLDYTNDLSLILLNSQVGYKYNNKNKALLTIFDNYFRMLRDNRRYIPFDDSLFETIPFNFFILEGFDDENDIINFLNYYSYAKKLEGKSLELLNNYKKYITNREKNNELNL